MSLCMRLASHADVRQLAGWNRQLVEDGQSGNPMSDAELEERMRRWLATDHRAVIFEEPSGPVGYAVYRAVPNGLYLQQFFVCREHRRRGIGRRALELFRKDVLPAGATLFLDVNPRNRRALAFWSALGFENYAVSFRS